MLARTKKVGSAWCVCFFCLALAMPTASMAKSFKGMTPGKTTREKVIDKFGDPTKEFSKGGKLSDGINYQGDEAIAGTLEANFYFDKHGVLFRIDVYPARELTRAQVIKVYGEDFTRGTTPKGAGYFQYAKKGLTVFFDKDADRVRVFMFTESASNKDSAWGG